MRNHRIAVLLGTVAMAAGWQSPAFAQDGSGTELASGDIIVTARRTEERLQDVPISIAAYTAVTLERKAVRDVYDLQQATPGLTVAPNQSQGRTAGGYNIRGQKQAADDAPPGVVSYLNDVPVFGPEISRAFFDIANVQVLKGPQGTLFGKNTNGGAILINSAKPTDVLEGYVKGRYGNYNDRYLEGAVNLPLADGIALRVAGNIERRDGFTKNLIGKDLDNLHYENFRVSLKVAPVGSGFENLTVFNHTNIDEQGTGYIVSQVFPNPAILRGGPMAPARLAALQQAQAIGPRRVSEANTPFSWVRAFGVSNTTTLELSDSLTLKNVAGYHQLKYDGQNDYDNTDFDFLSVDYSRYDKQFTEELQLQGNFLDNRLSTIVGGYYSHNKQDPLYGDSRTPYGLTSTGYVYYPEVFINRNENHIRLESKALFAQASFKLTDRLSLTAGYRYTWDHQNTAGRFTRLFANGTQACTLPTEVPEMDPRFTVDLPGCYLTAKSKFSAGNYTVSAEFKPTDDMLVYLAHRHGYKSGGANTTGGFYGAEGIFGPEKVDDVEFGLKASGYLGGMRYSFSGAAFHSWYNDLQVTQVITFILPNGGILTPSLTQNVAKAKLWGGDIDVSLEPVQGFTLTGSFNYFDGKLNNGLLRLDSAGGAVVDVSGYKFRTQPKIRYTLGANFETGIGGDSMLNASAFYSWTKSYYTSYDATPGNFIPSYGLLNGRVGLSNIAGTGIDVSAFGKNITNEEYIVGNSNATTFGLLSKVYGEPRTYGVEAAFKF
ncbi:MAG: TonB-dependent receptor [Novosphingobium sp.]|nr:TonB-dependent receptor [Novosphingobium sp.]